MLLNLSDRKNEIFTEKLEKGNKEKGKGFQSKNMNLYFKSYTGAICKIYR